MALNNADLNCYFSQKVQIQKYKNERAKEYILPIVQKLLQHINKQDCRFSSNVEGVGSFFQGLKTNDPDEFDFNVMLDGLHEFDYAPSTKRYYGFDEDIDESELNTLPDVGIKRTRRPLPEPLPGYSAVKIDFDDLAPCWQNSKDMIFSRDIIPFLVKKVLKEKLQNAIRELNLREKLRLGRKSRGPALILRIPYGKDDIPEISVDFAPVIPMAIHFPEDSNWPCYTPRWPSRNKIKSILSVGINVIAKKAFDWMDSYSECEYELMKDMDKDGGCRKKTLRIMKSLRHQFWCITSKPTLSSYHLKNILLWECENHPYTSDWEPHNIGKRIHGMIKKLLKNMEKGEIKQYFNKEVNLLNLTDLHSRDTLQLEIAKIREFLAEPEEYLLEHDQNKLKQRQVEE